MKVVFGLLTLIALYLVSAGLVGLWLAIAVRVFWMYHG